MLGEKIQRVLKSSGILFSSILTIVLALILFSLLAGCSAPSATSEVPTISWTAPSAHAPVPNIQATTSSLPSTSTATAARPQGELVAARQSFGNENFLPWLDPESTHYLLVYDMLIYWDYENHKFLPGLAEKWEVSPDGMTTTFHLKKGVQFSDGWGEFTSADVKYNFEMQASPKSVGKTAQTRRIASMDTPDPYTLVIHFKDSYPTFYVDMSMANSGVCQGFVCKKYVETVGEDVAAKKPIGTGPYRLVHAQSGAYMKFEALDSHWRVVPEFKTLTLRLISETSTLVAALKNKEADLADVPANQLADLIAAGVAMEVSPLGGSILVASLGGMIISADKRYDPSYHNKDPWTDPKVRKAMAIAIDRQAMCKALLAGYANPAGVPLYTLGIEKYQYPFDPATARQLLKDAGYPNGFSFRVISSVMQTFSGSQQVMEALAGYWQQIGLDPKITVIDYNSYYTKNISPCKAAGDVFLSPMSSIADQLSKAEIMLMPNASQVTFQDEGSYAIYRDNPKATFEERNVVVNKLNQYYFDNIGPIPLFRSAHNYAWNSDKMLPWPHDQSARPLYLEYVRHAQPLNTFRLFSPWPSR